ncbi:hypothetical protein [Streptococcus sanguinis]|jgi:hypothetical protein|uniref:Uncharacterized protein n=1 Tax=Streptococcus sanguinis TaxID=1305 RepID=A0AAE8K981_STRSA|nr:hypothetical protein [Streptococcus sanguinis]MBF1698422.1 hypothetical protein [Streptococcus cristatus]MBZ2021859.1 hypothetical protein [Streptococcus sanguinis]MBZ2068344.1 hypothetical protein [Streptococcus sanguinis]MBZ2073982.1 hypothetical protein [Streptococcus sanguinis]MBZ2081905.1 hypothetical protein [Streptococcus sanguinis]
MPLEYFEIKKLLRSQISLVDSLMNKALKYMLLYGILLLVFSVRYSQNTSDSIIIFILLLIMGMLYRLNVLSERISLKNLTITFRKGNFLETKYIELLVSDIESSLNKINSFVNWSCGILATISIFASTIYLNFLKDLVSKEELAKLLGGENSSLQNSFIGGLWQLMLMIILVLLVYYLTVQAFTYDRRFVIIVLKSSRYIDENDEIIVGFLNKLQYIIKNFISGI